MKHWRDYVTNIEQETEKERERDGWMDGYFFSIGSCFALSTKASAFLCSLSLS